MKYGIFIIIIIVFMGFGINIGGGLSGAATGAAIGSAVPGIGTAVGAIGGGILGLFSGGGSGTSREDQEKLMDRAWGYEKEGMALQYGYNEQAANATQQRNKEMWDYTNFENQRKHLENAGLSVGLMYGNGGGMQASSAGGSQEGVSAPKGNPVEVALQNKAMGLQLQQIQSQTMLNASQAAKNTAEAEKIKGVDTRATEAAINQMIAQTKSEDERKKLIKQQTWTEIAQAEVLNSTVDYQNAKKDEVLWNIRTYQKSLEKLSQEVIGAKMDNSIKAQCMEEIVQQASLTTAQMMANLTKTNADVQKIAADIQKAGYDVMLKAEGNEIAWKTLEQAYEKLLMEMDVKEEQISIAYKNLIVEALKGVAQAALGATAVKNSLGGRNVVKGFTK